MEKKTHIVCANLVSLYLMKPDSISSLIFTCGFASLGGLVPDVDLKDSTSDKLLDRLMTALITVVIMSFLIKYFFDINLYCKIRERVDIFSYLISICLFIVVAYFGSKSSHRSFTHSILGLFIYSGILFYGFGFGVIPYFVSHLSHIILDLFNKKGVALFYPSKFRFCFELCDSNGKVNKFLFCLFSILIVVYLILISMGIKI
jgi:inner membrane protein